MKKWFLLILICTCLEHAVFSQAINDAGLWTTINVEKKINKRLECFLTQEFRLKENYTQTNLFYTDIGLAIKPLGFMKFSFSYRSIQKARIDETFSFRHRLTLDLILKKKFGKIIPSFRQRIQMQLRNVYSGENGRLPEWYARERVEIKYDLDLPIKPFAAVELRYQLKDPREMGLNGTWDRIRYSFGLDYKLNSKNQLSFYYLMQRGLYNATSNNLFITGISYTVSL